MQLHLDDIISNNALERTWRSGWLLGKYSNLREPNQESITTRAHRDSTAPERYLQRLRASAFYQAHVSGAAALNPALPTWDMQRQRRWLLRERMALTAATAAAAAAAAAAATKSLQLEARGL